MPIATWAKKEKSGEGTTTKQYQEHLKEMEKRYKLYDVVKYYGDMVKACGLPDRSPDV